MSKAAKKSNESMQSEFVQKTQLYQTILQSMGEGFVLYDKQGVAVNHNSAACEILDLSPEELINLKPIEREFIQLREDGTKQPPEEHPAMITLNTGLPMQGQVVGIQQEGVVKWISVDTQPIFTTAEQEEPDFALTVFRDISTLLETQKNLEYELIVSKVVEQLLTLKQTKAELKVKLDEAFKLIVNSGALLIENQGGVFLGPPEPSSEMNQHLDFPINDQMGTGLGFMRLFPKQAFQEKDRHFVNMISKIIASIVELEFSDKKLKLAQHSSKLASIGQLAAGVGHEINNPLAIVSGHLHILTSKLKKAGAMTERFEHSIEKMEVSIARVAKIVKGLKSFGRSEEEKQQTFCVADIIQECVDMVGEIYSKDGIRLTFHNGCKETCNLFGNRGRIQQVIMNMLSNSKDATEGQEQREIHIDLTDKGESFTVTLRDNGPGIPKEDSEKIFDAFYTTKDLHKGTGMGLATVHSAVTEHGGTVQLNQDFNGGAEFNIHWKKANGVANPTPEQTSEEVMTEVIPKQQDSKKVLLVDDEEELRTILQEIIEDAGFVVDTASDGEQGLAMAKAGNYDLIVSDIKMPKVTGPEMIREIVKTIDPCPPIFFVTGGVNIDQLDLQKELDGYLKGYFEKPFDEDKIVEEINAAIQNDSTEKKAS